MPYFWPPTPKRNFLTVFLTVKVFRRFRRQKYRQVIWLIAKFAANKGIAGIAHRRDSGFGEIFRLDWL